MQSEAIELQDIVKRYAQSLAVRLREIRRYLHQRPELSEQEYETTEFIEDLIVTLGLTPHLAGDRRGAWVDLDANVSNQKHRVAIRGDIDALPIQTLLETSYASRVDCVMHACGHDAHATMAWGALAILTELANDNLLPDGTATRIIFQPAEETSTGGRHMIESGALEGVDSAIALHVDPSRPVGTFGYRDGAFTAGCDSFCMIINGQAGHGARPHLTGDTVGAAAHWISTIYERLPRHQDAREPIVVNVGQISGGHAANVVPAEVKLSGTLRTLSAESAMRARHQLMQISEALELTYPVTTQLTFGTHTPPVVNDIRVNSLLRFAASKIVGDANVRDIEQPSMGAEDFAFFASKVPAAMMRIGVAGVDVGSQPLHTPTFDIDESALVHGAAVLALAAIELSTGNLP
ncbi:amidohydrolase [Rubripirellula amarantea]|nr:amidohydrolase [Rubripirellula amarantea]